MSPLLALKSLQAGWTSPLGRPLDLALMAGEVVGLSGPNGVGKSTILSAIAGQARVFAGEIRCAPGVRLGWQPQAPAPLDGVPLNGHELLALTGASPAGLPAWLADCLDWRLDRLSGGQRHYLSLWAVLAAPADLLLLDEPTNHLDAAGVRHLAQALKERAAAGAAILVVSHDAPFLASACGRILAMEAEDVE